MTKAQLIKSMKFAEKTHLNWAREQEYRRRMGFPPSLFVGGATTHRRWVQIYKAVISVLEKD